MIRITFRIPVALFLLVAAVASLAQRVEMKYLVAGSDAGTNVTVTNPDGTFVSESKLSVAGTNIESKMSGKIEGGLLTEFSIEEKRGDQGFKMSAAGGKLKVEASGRSNEVDFKPPKTFFANMHPMLSRSLADAYGIAQGGSQTIPIFVLEAARIVDCGVTLKRTQPVTVGGQKKAVHVFSLRFPSMLEMDVMVAEGGPAVLWDVPSQLFKVVALGYEELAADPTTRYPELSQPTLNSRTEKAVKIPMRDGVNLVADVARPDTEGKFPTVLVRTPYGRSGSMLQGDWYAKRGYVFVVQDVRGRFDSEGEFDPFVNERKDGVDTIDWVVKQPWSDGKVGMIGGSYLGYVQWCAAAEGHPALKCIVPQVAPPDMFFNIPYEHGVFMLYGAIWWSAVVKERGSVDVQLAGFDGAEKLTTLPLTKVDDAVFGKSIPFYDKWLDQTTWSSFGSANYYKDLSKVRVPALHISGWFDGDGIGTKMNWARMRELGRRNQWLIYGPWTHFFNSTTKLGDVDYGPDAILELDSLYLRWFDTWLKDKDVGLSKIPRVKVFVTGANEWREMEDWPHPGSTQGVLYLSGSGPANGPTSLGVLTKNVPPKDQEPDRYTYNPANASVRKEDTDVTKATTVLKLEANEDQVLLFKTEPMSEPLEIAGPLEAELYFSTSAKDTDLFASLVDIDEKGVLRQIGMSGKIRGRYLSGWDNPKPLIPGRVYKAVLPLWDTAHRIAKGHRLGLVISSSGFPAYARNLGTADPIGSGTRMVAQSQTIYHDAHRPSALRFRILPKQQ